MFRYLRANVLVFLAVLLFLEFADVELQSATLSVVTAKINRPWAITVGFWLIFFYSFTVYFLAARKELALFSLKNAKDVGFFSALNRMELVKRLRVASGVDYLQPGSGLVKQHDEKSTVIQYETVGIPTEALEKVQGFNVAEHTFTYAHEAEDHAFFKRVVPLLRPSVNFNYFVYVFPAHVGAALIGFAIVEHANLLLR